MSFFTGTPAQIKQQSLLGPEQQPAYMQLQNASRSKGAGGAYGDAADYYRGLLSNDSEDFNAFAAPELRRFREQTAPDIFHQFAGAGAGSIGSSGHRNALLNASTDLSERLGAIRAGLRQSAARGLTDIGAQALNPTNENIYMQAQPGFLDAVGKGIGGAIGNYGGTPLNWLNTARNAFGDEGVQQQAQQQPAWQQKKVF